MSPRQVVEAGALVRVQYKKQAGNGRWGLWEMTAVYLGFDERERSFSLRPHAGTTTLSRRWNPVTEIEVVMESRQVTGLGGSRSPRMAKHVKTPRRIGNTEKPEHLS